MKRITLLSIIFLFSLFSVYGQNFKDTIESCSVDATVYNSANCQLLYDNLLSNPDQSWYDNNPGNYTFIFNDTFTMKATSFNFYSVPASFKESPHNISVFSCLDDSCVEIGRKDNLSTSCVGSSVATTWYDIPLTTTTFTFNKIIIKVWGICTVDAGGVKPNFVDSREINFTVSSFFSGSNELPTFNITTNSTQICLEENGTTLFYDINAVDPEDDTIYYAQSFGYKTSEAKVYDFDLFKDVFTINPTGFTYGFLLYCKLNISSAVNRGCSYYFDAITEEAVLPDGSDVASGYFYTPCTFQNDPGDLTQQSRQIYYSKDAVNLQNNRLYVRSSCNQSNEDYLMFRNTVKTTPGTSIFYYIEQDPGNVVEIFTGSDLNSDNMQKVLLNKTMSSEDYQTRVYVGSTNVYNISKEDNIYGNFYNFDTVNTNITFNIYKPSYLDDETSGSSLLYTGTILSNETSLNRLFIENIYGGFYVDDVAFYILGYDVNWTTDKPNNRTYTSTGTDYFRTFVTDAYHLSDFTNYKDTYITVNTFCVDALQPDVLPTTPTQRGTLQGLINVLRAIFGLSSIFSSFPIIKAVGTIFYILIFIMFLFQSKGFDFLGSLAKSSLIVFIYSLMGLTYIWVGIVAMIMTVFSIILIINFNQRGAIE